jgi:hypothetical protein
VAGLVAAACAIVLLVVAMPEGEPERAARPQPVATVEPEVVDRTVQAIAANARGIIDGFELRDRAHAGTDCTPTPSPDHLICTMRLTTGDSAPSPPIAFIVEPLTEGEVTLTRPTEMEITACRLAGRCKSDGPRVDFGFTVLNEARGADPLDDGHEDVILPGRLGELVDRDDPRATDRALRAAGYEIEYVLLNDEGKRAEHTSAPPPKTRILSVLGRGGGMLETDEVKGLQIELAPAR